MRQAEASGESRVAVLRAAPSGGVFLWERRPGARPPFIRMSQETDARRSEPVRNQWPKGQPSDK